MRTCSRIRPERSASCNAKASGAFREPGHNTTSRTPPWINSSTTMRAWVVEGFTPTACHSPLTMRAAQRPEEEVPTAAHQSHQPREPRAKLQVPFSEAPSGLDAAEELQRRGGDGLWPLEEPEMTGVGYLQVATVGQGVSYLASQVRRRHHVVGEADHQHRRGDAAIRRQSVALRGNVQLATQSRGLLDRPHAKRRDPVADSNIIIECLA